MLMLIIITAWFTQCPMFSQLQKQPFPLVERVSILDLPTLAVWAVSVPLGPEWFSLWMCLKLGIMAQVHSIRWGVIVSWNRRLSKGNNRRQAGTWPKHALMMLTPFESDHFKLADWWWMAKVLTDIEPPTLQSTGFL